MYRGGATPMIGGGRGDPPPPPSSLSSTSSTLSSSSTDTSTSTTSTTPSSTSSKLRSIFKHVQMSSQEILSRNKSQNNNSTSSISPISPHGLSNATTTPTTSAGIGAKFGFASNFVPNHHRRSLSSTTTTPVTPKSNHHHSLSFSKPFSTSSSSSASSYSNAHNTPQLDLHSAIEYNHYLINSYLEERNQRQQSQYEQIIGERMPDQQTVEQYETQIIAEIDKEFFEKKIFTNGDSDGHVKGDDNTDHMILDHHHHDTSSSSKELSHHNNLSTSNENNFNDVCDDSILEHCVLARLPAFRIISTDDEDEDEDEEDEEEDVDNEREKDEVDGVVMVVDDSKKTTTSKTNKKKKKKNTNHSTGDTIHVLTDDEFLQYIEMEKRKLTRQVTIVSKRLSDMITTNEHKFSTEMYRIRSIEQNLATALQTVGGGRQALGGAQKHFTTVSLSIVDNHQRRQVLQSMIDTLYRIKSLHSTIDHVQQLLVVEKDFPTAIRHYRQCSQTLAKLTASASSAGGDDGGGDTGKFECVREMNHRLTSILSLAGQQMDTVLSRMPEHYCARTFAELMLAYEQIGKSNESIHSLLLHFTNVIHDKAFAIVHGYVQLFAGGGVQQHSSSSLSSSVQSSPKKVGVANDTTTNTNSFRKQPFNDLCQQLKPESFLSCLTDLCRAMWILMQNYFHILCYYRKQRRRSKLDRKVDDDDRSSSSSSFNSLQFVITKLEQGALCVWSGVQHKIRTLISSVKFVEYAPNVVLMKSIIESESSTTATTTTTMVNGGTLGSPLSFDGGGGGNSGETIITDERSLPHPLSSPTVLQSQQHLPSTAINDNVQHHHHQQDQLLFTFEEFIKILTVCEKMIEIGEEFCAAAAETSSSSSKFNFTTMMANENNNDNVDVDGDDDDDIDHPLKHPSNTTPPPPSPQPPLSPSSTITTELQQTLYTQTRAYFASYHQVSMSELRIFLENETWTRCPIEVVDEYELIAGLQEFAFCKTKLLKLARSRSCRRRRRRGQGRSEKKQQSTVPNRSSSISSPTASTTSFLLSSSIPPTTTSKHTLTVEQSSKWIYFLEPSSSNDTDDDDDDDAVDDNTTTIVSPTGPFDDVLSMSVLHSHNDDDDGEEEEDGENDNHDLDDNEVTSTNDVTKVMEMIATTNTALNVVRLIGRYMHIMYLLRPISHDIIRALMELFDYYFFTVYRFFACDALNSQWLAPVLATLLGPNSSSMIDATAGLSTTNSTTTNSTTTKHNQLAQFGSELRSFIRRINDTLILNDHSSSTTTNSTTTTSSNDHHHHQDSSSSSSSSILSSPSLNQHITTTATSPPGGGSPIKRVSSTTTTTSSSSAATAAATTTSMVVKHPPPMLPSYIPINCSTQLFALGERLMAIESLIFIARQFYNLYPFLLDYLRAEEATVERQQPQQQQQQINKKRQTDEGFKLLQFYHDEMYLSVESLTYQCLFAVATKLLPYETVIASMGATKWDLKEIPSIHSRYVDLFVAECTTLHQRYMTMLNEYDLQCLLLPLSSMSSTSAMMSITSPLLSPMSPNASNTTIDVDAVTTTTTTTKFAYVDENESMSLIKLHSLSLRLNTLLWQCLIRIGNRCFVEGFASARKCTNEGRALMQLDYQQFLTQIEKIIVIYFGGGGGQGTNSTNTCGTGTASSIAFATRQAKALLTEDKEFVEEYIKAYYLTEIIFLEWIRQRQPPAECYTLKQIHSLINCIAHDNRKTKSALMNAVEQLYQQQQQQQHSNSTNSANNNNNVHHHGHHRRQASMDQLSSYG